jgi:hypothetical protein
MAAQTCKYAQHATLSGTTADSVTFTSAVDGGTVSVTNRDASNTLYFTVNGATAVALADETYAVLPLQSFGVSVGPTSALVLSIVGNGNAYSAHYRDSSS